MSSRLAKARRSSRRTASFMVAASLLIALTGCGDGGSGSSEKSADESAATAAQVRLDAATAPTDLGLTAPLDKAPEEGKVAYMIRINVEGAAAYADAWPELLEKVGWEGRVIAVDPADPQAGSNGIKQAVAAGADYIAVQVFGYNQVKAGMAEAKAAGVPVFFGSGVGDVLGDKNGLYGNSFNLDGAVDLGAGIMDAVIADSDGGGHVLYVNYPDADIVGLAAEPTKSRFEENCPECTWHQFDMSTEQLNSGAVVEAVVSEVRKTPETKYVVMSVAGAAAGLRQALDAARLNDVKILLIGNTDEQFDGVRDGEYFAIGNVGIADVLWSQLDQMLRYDQGMDVLQDEHATRPYSIWNENNVGETTSWRGPENYADRYLKLWGVTDL